MTPAIPPDAKRVVLAAVVPCEQCKGTGVRHCGVVDCSTDGEHPCTFCLSTGTRTVVTDIEVEQRESPFMVVGHDNPEGPSLIARPDGWYPVEVEQ